MNVRGIFRPNRQLKMVAIMSLVVSIVVMTNLSAPSLALGGPSEEKPPQGLRPGDVVNDHGALVVVPRRGFAVGAEAQFADGAVEELTVETERDGTVVVMSWGSEASSEPPTGPLPGSDQGCNETGYSLTNYKWYKTFSWYLKDTYPGGLSMDSVETAFRASVSAVTNAHNDCGLADNVSASHNFVSRTARGMNITSSATCGNPDGYNVLGFGALPTGYLGYACWWWTDTGKQYKEATEVDAKLNSSSYWWRVGPKPATCDFDDPKKWQVESVVTHEVGHIFGMAHVAENTYPWQTMSRYANGECDDSASTLGRGDVTGLDLKY